MLADGSDPAAGGSRDACRGSSRRGSTRSRPRRRRFSRTRRCSGRSSGPTRSRASRTSSSLAARGASARARAQGVRPARASLGRRRRAAVRVRPRARPRRRVRPDVARRAGRRPPARRRLDRDASRRPGRRPRRDPRPPPARGDRVLAGCGPRRRELVAARGHGAQGVRGPRLGGSARMAAALRFYGRLRELDPAVEDDPYFLLSLGYGLAAMHGYLEKGADELERAAEALAVSDPAAAAQATDHTWRVRLAAGRSGGRVRVLSTGRESSPRDASLSPEKQIVVAQVARFFSLAGRYDEALPLVEQAIDMAEELGDDELLGDALNTRGVVRGSLGDPGWEQDLTRSLELGAAQQLVSRGSCVHQSRLDVAGHCGRSRPWRGDHAGGSRVLRADGVLVDCAALVHGQPRRHDVPPRARGTRRWHSAEGAIVGEPHYMAASRDSAFEPTSAWRGATNEAPPRTRASPWSVRGRSATPRLSTQHSSWRPTSRVEGETGRPRTRSWTSSALRRAPRLFVVRAALVCHDLRPRAVSAGDAERRRRDSMGGGGGGDRRGRARTSCGHPRAHRRTHAGGRRMAASGPDCRCGWSSRGGGGAAGLGARVLPRRSARARTFARARRCSRPRADSGTDGAGGARKGAKGEPRRTVQVVRTSGEPAGSRSERRQRQRRAAPPPGSAGDCGVRSRSGGTRRWACPPPPTSRCRRSRRGGRRTRGPRAGWRRSSRAGRTRRS